MSPEESTKSPAPEGLPPDSTKPVGVRERALERTRSHRTPSTIKDALELGSTKYTPLECRNITRQPVTITIAGERKMMLASLQRVVLDDLWSVEEKKSQQIRDACMAPLRKLEADGKLWIHGGQPVDDRELAREMTMGLGFVLCLLVPGIRALLRLIPSIGNQWPTMTSGEFWKFWDPPTTTLPLFYIAALLLIAALQVEKKLGRGWIDVTAAWIARYMVILVSTLTAFVVPISFLVWKGGVVTTFSGARLVIEESFPALVLVTLASLFPAMLFFVRATERRTTLRERFYRDVLRIDPEINDLNDLHARFGEEIDEVLGPRDSTTTYLGHGTVLPVLNATLILSLGWSLALLDQQPFHDNLLAQLTNVFTSDPYPRSLIPVPANSPLAWAFLGSYFFSIGFVLRGHLRGDLEPKSFSALAVRGISVIVLGLLLNQLPNSFPAPLAFLVGVVPDTFLIWLQDRGRAMSGKLTQVVEKRPLTDIEGIDLYDRSRLADEGINNIEALAHHDIVRLLLRTRIPAPRIIDWVDQAILNLHTSPNDETQNEASVHARLRAIGIRTATDLIAASAAKQPSDPIDREQAAINVLERATGGPGHLCLLIRTIEDDEWLQFIKTWRGGPSV